MLNGIKRFARIDFRLDQAERTPEGFLQGVVPVTKCGVFPYRNIAQDGTWDGTWRYEARLPEHVHKKESLDTMCMAPAQVEHVAMVDASNVDALKVGHLGSNYEVDKDSADGTVRIPIRIDGARGLAAYDAGKRELSMGYYLNLIPAPEGATYQGKPYTHIQTDIVYNHVAVTDKARLGPELRLDSADAVEGDGKPPSNPSHSQEHPMLKKYSIDGIEYEAAPEVINLLNKETRRADAAMQKPAVGEKCPCCGQIMKGNMDASEKQALQAAFDSEKSALQAKVDAALADKKTAEDALKKLEGEIPTRAAAIAKDNADAFAVAQAVLPASEVQKLTGKDAAEVRKAVIMAKYPTIKLDGKDAAYMDGLFTAVQAGIKDTGTQAGAQNRAASAPVIAGDKRQDGQEITEENCDGSFQTAAAARAAMEKRNREAHKKPAMAFGKA